MTAYENLMAYVRQTAALSQVSQRLGWDQEAMMPAGAGPQRAEENAALAAVLHARNTDAQLGDWLAEAEEVETDETARAQLRHVRFDFDRATLLPADLASELARVCSLGQRAWADARAGEDVPAFLPFLENLVSLSREKAAAYSEGGDAYDALLQDYEPGTTGEEIAATFDAMRPRLVALREKILGADAPADLTGQFDEDIQMEMAREMAVTFGYDLDHGRIDKVVHPFMSGSGLDVRITTRTDPDRPFDCLYSTIHETGHAAYEQGISRDYLLTPLGRGISMGVHESQSRIYENQLGRSRAFTGWMFDRMTDYFGDIGAKDADAFYAAVNRVSSGYIRTEADEVHYNLHVMLRFDLERALMRGDLQVKDLEGAWNDRFFADFGVAVDKPSNGVLQDVHWAFGAFAYFPTYALGNVYAGCLYEALGKDVPDFEAALSEGNTRPACDWLRDNVQKHGGLYAPQDVIARAARQAPNPEPLLAHLEAKYTALYNL